NTLTTSIGKKTGNGFSTESIGLIDNAKKTGINASYLTNTANVEVSSKTFMRDEIYSLGISFELNDGSETAVFHIPGRIQNNIDIQVNKIGEFNKQLNSSNINTWDNLWRTKNTATLNTVDNTGDLAYWRSGEVYPDGYNFP